MKLVALVLMLIVMEMFCQSEAFWGRRRRRRRRRCHTPSTNGGGWVNHWDHHFKFTCPRGQALTYIESLYSACHRDRVFKFSCARNKATANFAKCSWTDHWVNDWDQILSFKCPFHGFLTGIESYHSNRHEDRRFKFRCCHSRNYVAHICKTLGYINQWRQSPFSFRTPRNYFFVAATSYHDNGQEDRRWKFEYCKVVSKWYWRRLNRKLKQKKLR